MRTLSFVVLTVLIFTNCGSGENSPHEDQTEVDSSKLESTSRDSVSTVKIDKPTDISEYINEGAPKDYYFLTQTSFRNGDEIKKARTTGEWKKFIKEKIPCYAYFEFNDQYSDYVYYNYYALIDKRIIAPYNTHILNFRDVRKLYLKKHISYSPNGRSKIVPEFSNIKNPIKRIYNGQLEENEIFNIMVQISEDSINYHGITCYIDMYYQGGEIKIEDIEDFKGYENMMGVELKSWERSRKFLYCGRRVMVVNDDQKVLPSPKNIDLTIGNIEVMDHLLNVKQFRNGDIIKKIEDPVEWEIAIRDGIPAYCYFNNDTTTSGFIYNIHAYQDERGLIPKGYRNWNLLDVFEFDPCKQNKFVNEGTCVFRKKSSNCASYFNISQLPKLSPSGWRNDEGDFIDIDVGFYPQLNFTVAKYNKTYSRDDRIWGYCYQSQGDVLIPAWYGYGKIKWYKNSVPISSGYVMLIRDIHN